MDVYEKEAYRLNRKVVHVWINVGYTVCCARARKVERDRKSCMLCESEESGKRKKSCMLCESEESGKRKKELYVVRE